MAEETCTRCDGASPELAQLGGLCFGCASLALTEEDLPEIPGVAILNSIGRGGMGQVYKARQLSIDRLVALKILTRSLAVDASFRDRFAREARATGQLQHPGIVTVHEHGIHDETPYLLLEYVEGETLRARLGGQRLKTAEALSIASTLCDALEYAHEEGVIHRDIKPENILIDGNGKPKLADFGLAKIIDPKSAPFPASTLVAGTPNYMAPEQVENPSHVDHRADLYSLGVVLYEMLTGELPMGRFEKPSRRNPEVPTWVDSVVLRLLEKNPERRIASAAELRRRLASRSLRMRTVAPWSMGLVLVGILIWVLAFARPGIRVDYMGSLGETGDYPHIVVSRSGHPFVGWVGTPGPLRIGVGAWDPDQKWQPMDEKGVIDTDGGSPWLAVNSRGHPAVTWMNNQIYFRTWNGKEWAELGGSGGGEGVSGTRRIALYPTIAFDSNEHPVIGWHEGKQTGGRVRVKRWTGREWMDLSEGIHDPSHTCGQAIVAVDPEDRILVHWHRIIDNRYAKHVSRWDGETWEDLGSPGEDGIVGKLEHWDSSIALAPDGNPVLAWAATRQGVENVMLTRWTGTEWEDLGPVRKNWNYQQNPRLVINERGEMFVGWREQIQGRWWAVVRRRTEAGWADIAENVTEGLPDESSHSVKNFHIACDKAGTVYIVWTARHDQKPIQMHTARINW